MPRSTKRIPPVVRAGGSVPWLLKFVTSRSRRPSPSTSSASVPMAPVVRPEGSKATSASSADVPEAAVAPVLEEEVRRRVVRLEHVDPAVVVEVGGDDGHALADQAGDARPRRSRPRRCRRRGCGRGCSAGPGTSRSSRRGSRRSSRRGIARPTSRRRTPGSSRRRGRVGRRGRSRGRWCCSPTAGSRTPAAVGHVAERRRSLRCGRGRSCRSRDEEVGPAVAVVVGDREAHPPAQAADARPARSRR